MSYPTCEDCGSRISGGHCVYCHEEVFIEQQYVDLGEDVPEIIEQKAVQQEAHPSRVYDRRAWR